MATEVNRNPMEMILQPLAGFCCVSRQPFADGDRVVSYLVRGAAPEIGRYDVLSERTGDFHPEGTVVCRWLHVFKPRAADENPGRTLKLTAENLFLTLMDPLTEPTEENTRLLQFLALLLERKKLLRPRGLSPDREKQRYEHAKTKQIFEVPAGELTPHFFVAIQEQLSVLVGPPKAPAPPLQPAASA